LVHWGPRPCCVTDETAFHRIRSNSGVNADRRNRARAVLTRFSLAHATEQHIEIVRIVRPCGCVISSEILRDMILAAPLDNSKLADAPELLWIPWRSRRVSPFGISVPLMLAARRPRSTGPPPAALSSLVPRSRPCCFAWFHRCTEDHSTLDAIHSLLTTTSHWPQNTTRTDPSETTGNGGHPSFLTFCSRMLVVIRRAS
jgi:hypothetical protein